MLLLQHDILLGAKWLQLICNLYFIATQDAVVTQPDVNLESQWDEVSPQLSTVLQGNTDFSTDVVPFDAASDVPIDEQKYVVK
jgi:hypothetical protein